MGYYYDWLEKRWSPIDHDRKLSREQSQEIERRKYLLDDLITEIEASNNSVVKLYAGLFARALAASDELLLRSHGKRLAEMGMEGHATERRAAG